MNKGRFILVFCLLLLVWFAGTSLVLAQSKIAVDCGFFDCTVADGAKLIDNILQWIVKISLSVATIAIVYAGIIMVIYADNDGERKNAKEILKLVGKGLIFVLGAYVLVKTILTFFGVSIVTLQ